MLLPDPLHLKHTILKTSVLSSAFQLQGNRPRQEDYVFYDSTDTFIIADGMGGMDHGDIAGKLAVESATWAIHLAKQRISYWKDKKLLGGRVFRSVNWTLYNKRRESGFESGLGSTLTILLFGEKQFYLYSVGDSPAYLYRDKKIRLLTPLDRDPRGYLTKAIGISKNAPPEFFFTDKIEGNDLFLLSSDGVADHLSETKMEEILLKAGDSKEEIDEAVKNVVISAEKQGSKDNMTACIIKCIVY